MSEPYPKSVQLSRGPRKAARKRAQRREWAELIEAATELKGGDCRLCRYFAHPDLTVFRRSGPIEWHHIVPRSQLGGDEIDNLMPLHRECHREVTEHVGNARERLVLFLTPAERDYGISRGGPGFFERHYGATPFGCEP